MMIQVHFAGCCILYDSVWIWCFCFQLCSRIESLGEILPQSSKSFSFLLLVLVWKLHQPRTIDSKRNVECAIDRRCEHLIHSRCYHRGVGAIRFGFQNSFCTLINHSFFFGGPLSDYFGRRWGMGIGCFLTIVATLMQTFSPRGNLGCFIAGRVVIGVGQGIALST